MRTKLFLAIAVAALLATGAAFAGAATAARPRGVLYSFHGRLTATPGGGALSLTVEGGNRPALRALIGQPAAQTLAYDESTHFVRWSNGVPSAAAPADLDPDDYVWVHVRAPRGASLDAIEHAPAFLVGDHGPEFAGQAKPLYLFTGTVASVGSSSVSVDVGGGNRRALRLLVGQSAGQTFAVDGSTVYLRRQGRVPAAIALSDLKAGDRVAVRIRADAAATLAEVEATPAARVVEHEPASRS